MRLTRDISEFLDAHQEEALELLMKLAQIPAPSNHEELRAAFCRDWLERQGAKGVYMDEALNVIYPVGCCTEGPLVVYMAHSDVVFPDRSPLPLRISGGRIFCPGIGDDTANAVALLMTAKYLASRKLSPREGGVLLVINAGEEGLGNLKGSRKLLADFGARIREFVSFDAHDCLGVNRAVGSRRYRISIDTVGGHSFADFGRPNAIACLASMIARLYAVKVPEAGKTTYNVGLISGGTSVNAIAQHAEMLYEFRSDEASSMAIMERHLTLAVEAARAGSIQVTVTPVGDRPCSGPVNQALETALMRRASEAALRAFGREIIFQSGSTDCNIPLSLGIPSICVGCYNGSGSHTREEYVEISSLRPGLAFALDLILQHF